MAEGYSQLEVASSEHTHSSPEVVSHSTFAPEVVSPRHGALKLAYDHKSSQRSLSHQSPELDPKKWRPEVCDTSSLRYVGSNDLGSLMRQRNPASPSQI